MICERAANGMRSEREPTFRTRMSNSAEKAKVNSTWKILARISIGLHRAGWRCVSFTIGYTPATRNMGEDDWLLMVLGGTANLPRPCREGGRPDMQITPLERYILNDEAITRGLGDVEARMLVEWLVERAGQLAFAARTDTDAWNGVRGLCRRGRVFSCFVRLWSQPESRGAALQLVASERQHWPLPSGDVAPDELLEKLLSWVDRQDEIVADSLARMAA